ncbi:MAG: hypothetical protein QG594_2153 [Bacteroidota bacterium]|nr:hypothetical protein [Bacteroidota bacterium]
MINPSAIGWIDKYFFKQQQSNQILIDNVTLFYEKIRQTGFIYGHIISFDTDVKIDTKNLVEKEIQKVALLNILYTIYKLSSKDTNPENFIAKALDFYNKLHPQESSFLKNILPNTPPSYNLEKIIEQRIQTNIDILSKNFSNIVTNSLLFVDVLTFSHYLSNEDFSNKYIKKLEEAVISIISISLKTKSTKSKHDDLLIKLFEASVRYSKFSNINIQNIDELNLSYFNSDLEKFYLIDMASLALWTDGKLENEEAYFLYKLAERLSVSDEFVSNCIQSIEDFLSKHKKDIPYFNYSNPVKHFYDHTSKSVETLIIRNKNRLVKELSESKELMILLAKSTTRDLDEKEKKKVKKQLLDICKTIPSLTIFLLPGGSLLLPILIKFIPKMLPSAFNENLEKD